MIDCGCRLDSNVIDYCVPQIGGAMHTQESPNPASDCEIMRVSFISLTQLSNGSGARASKDKFAVEGWYSAF